MMSGALHLPDMTRMSSRAERESLTESIAESDISVIDGLAPMDDKKYHALESARIREKVATARGVANEQASRQSEPYPNLSSCAARLLFGWSILASRCRTPGSAMS
mmetsp:Transcript_23637/g.59943  ORF Transcript_23637/g.59943 Transcript_23637/m.59943 type:complete len:106 (-) Transcript_23637:159-476(-)